MMHLFTPCSPYLREYINTVIHATVKSICASTVYSSFKKYAGTIAHVGCIRYCTGKGQR
jgi:hypothetical protein